MHRLESVEDRTVLNSYFVIDDNEGPIAPHNHRIFCMAAIMITLKEPAKYLFTH